MGDVSAHHLRHQSSAITENGRDVPIPVVFLLNTGDTVPMQLQKNRLKTGLKLIPALTC